MMRITFQLLVCACVSCSLLSGGRVTAQTTTNRSRETAKAIPITAKPASIPSGDAYYVPMQPRFVAGPEITDFRWSFDGHYVIVAQRDFILTSLEHTDVPPAMTVSVTVWNASTHRSTVVWSDTGGQTRLDPIELLPGSNTAFLTTHTFTPTGDDNAALWRIDMRRATAASIPGFQSGDRVWVSPRLPYAFIQSSDQAGTTLKPLSASGAVGNSIRTPSDTRFPVGWSADGRSLVLRNAPVETSTIPANPKWGLLDGRDGGITTRDTQPDLYSGPIDKHLFDVQLVDSIPKAARGAVGLSPFGENSAKAAWLVQKNKGSEDRTLLAADATDVVPSPSNDAVMYINREGAFVISVLKAPRSMLEEARNAALRTMLLSNGKQIALGVMMWSQDNDEALPQADGVMTALKPYVKNDQVFAGANGEANAFVYTLNGGPLSAIKDPANTMMGYIPGPGGYAVVYSDGHVQWSKELPHSQPQQ